MEALGVEIEELKKEIKEYRDVLRQAQLARDDFREETQSELITSRTKLLVLLLRREDQEKRAGES